MLNLYEERVQFNVCHSLLDMSGAHLSRLNVPKTMVSTLQKNFFLHFDWLARVLLVVNGEHNCEIIMGNTVVAQ